MVERQKVKPQIEDAISGVLNGDALKTALDFIEYLRENKMNPRWMSTDTWKINYKDHVLCYFRLDPDSGVLHINPWIAEYEGDSLSDELKEIAWARANRHRPCQHNQKYGGCCGYRLKTVFGREYSNPCQSMLIFDDLGDGTTDCVKALLELRKSAILGGKGRKNWM